MPKWEKKIKIKYVSERVAGGFLHKRLWPYLKKDIKSLIKKEKVKMGKVLRKKIIEWKNEQKPDKRLRYDILLAEAGGIGDAVGYILEAIDNYLKEE